MRNDARISRVAERKQYRFFAANASTAIIGRGKKWKSIEIEQSQILAYVRSGKIVVPRDTDTRSIFTNQIAAEKQARQRLGHKVVVVGRRSPDKETKALRSDLRRRRRQSSGRVAGT